MKVHPRFDQVEGVLIFLKEKFSGYLGKVQNKYRLQGGNKQRLSLLKRSLGKGIDRVGPLYPS